MSDKKKYFILILIIFILAIILGIILKFSLFPSNNDNTTNFFSQAEDDSEMEEIIENSTELSIADIKSETYTDYDVKIDLTNLANNGNGFSVNDNIITISKSGIYYFSGKLSNGGIIIEATKDDDIVLVFENAEITSKDTSVINVQKANSVVINLVKGSNNVFTDSSNYSNLDEDGEPDSTIFSKSDLYITGTGTLTINSNYNDGIVSKDTLAIVDATLNIKSIDDGIRGKDFVSIKNAKINIEAGGDGIKSTNSSDEQLGYVIIDDSVITIESDADGIQAETVLNISDSDITITTNGEITKNNNQFNKNSNTTNEDNSTSSKGLKAGKEITINSGNIEINSTDDAIHSNYYIIINNGDISISSEDDGIHADNNIIINDGNVNISKSYEGIEANYIKINGGNISVLSTDDGINVSGGNDLSSMGRPGANNFTSVEDSSRQLIINGGNIYVNSDGDGLDANGSIVINGGNTTVAGSVNGGNAAFDYDQSCNVNGGELIVYGATGMWQNPSNTSTQYCICFGSSGKVGDKIELKDSNGKTIESFETKKSYGVITISSSELEEGETYTLYINGNLVESQKITDIITSNVTESENFGRGNMNNKNR